LDLTVYLLRTNDKGIEGAIRDDVLDLDIIELEDQSVINGVNQSKIALVIGPVKKNEPRWLSKIEEIFKIKLSEYYNQSTRAAILVDLGDYIIAYTFGYGRYDYPTKSIGSK